MTLRDKLIEKQAWHLGYWYSSSSDLDTVVQESNSAKIQKPSKSRAQGLLCVTTKTVTWITGSSSCCSAISEDHYPFTHIESCFIDDDFVNVIILIVQVKAGKNKIMLYRCNRDKDCREIAKTCSKILKDYKTWDWVHQVEDTVKKQKDDSKTVDRYNQLKQSYKNL